MASSPPTAPRNCLRTRIIACWLPPGSTGSPTASWRMRAASRGGGTTTPWIPRPRRPLPNASVRPGTRCSVANMDYGTDFWLIRQLELRDIRLVYAPPRAIGNYGDEIDNFVWPRHTRRLHLAARLCRQGRQARRLCAGQRALRCRHRTCRFPRGHFRDGDFAMLAGYPGTTYRHRMAIGVRQSDRVATSVARRAVPGHDRRRSNRGGHWHGCRRREVPYASQMQSLKNNLKRAQGELDGLRRSDALQHPKRGRGPHARVARHAIGRRQSTRRDIVAAQSLLGDAVAMRDRDQLLGAIRTQTQLLRAALTVQRRAIERAKPDAEREAGYQDRDEALIAGPLRQVQRRYAPAVEKAILARPARAVPGVAGCAACRGIRPRVRHYQGPGHREARCAVRRHQARR